MKGVEKGHPLKISAEKVEIRESVCNREFIKNIAASLDWDSLIYATKQVGLPEDMLPNELDASLLENDGFLLALHRVLLDVHVLEGSLTCPETGRVFPVKNGIPNMLLEEDECAGYEQ
eukprot:CAMPEP_0171454722 /NCGR_PEP_ID=MMETSP0945-20130129/1899_1 /TAXON_ID=109269 /ORGANISM="Vaucheria litorea, Strain CCMP2940" /LENGTH=117 /DNA_ID=CAMNT_0011979811 /DNA_START=73 /DNA_END=426 /DNA_ORIENTATION=-